MVQETRVQSEIESYQRLKKWFLIPTFLTLSIIRYRSRVKWSNPGKGVASSPTPQCCSYWKRSLQVTLDLGHQLYVLLLICKCEGQQKLWMYASMYTHTHTHIYINIYKYIYIYMHNYIFVYTSSSLSHRHHTFPWLSHTIHPYHSSLLTVLPKYILCPHRADINKFLWVNQQCHVHVQGSMEEPHFWVHSCFSGSISWVLFVFVRWIFKWEVSGHTAVVLRGVASRICSK